MGWSVVVENGSYNWTRVASDLVKGAGSGDNTGAELSQDYLFKMKAPSDADMQATDCCDQKESSPKQSIGTDKTVIGTWAT